MLVMLHWIKSGGGQKYYKFADYESLIAEEKLGQKMIGRTIEAGLSKSIISFKISPPDGGQLKLLLTPV